MQIQLAAVSADSSGIDLAIGERLTYISGCLCLAAFASQTHAPVTQTQGARPIRTLLAAPLALLVVSAAPLILAQPIAVSAVVREVEC